MEYITAPKKGSMSNRILFGHLLGLGFRHSSRGSSSGLGEPSESGFGGLSDRYLGAGVDLAVKKLGCSVRCAGELRESSRARVRRNEGRNGGMVGQLGVGQEKEATMRPLRVARSRRSP